MSDYSTRWGYSVALTGAAELPPLISVDDFTEATDGAMVSSEARIASVLAGASQAIRDWCGWHVSPNLSCTWVGQGEGRLLLLPCMGVTAIDSMDVNGSAVTAYEWMPNGLVRLKEGTFPDEWRSVEIEFDAGFDAVGALQAAVIQVASNALAATPGVREEHAGQVGTTYNQTANGVSGGIRLLDSDFSMLAPYRLTVR